jgi:cell division protein FtsN
LVDWLAQLLFLLPERTMATMRWVLGFLIVANIAYLVWQRSQEHAGPDSAQSPSAQIIETDTESLELLSEMDRAAVAKNTRAASAAPEQVEKRQLCWLLGPFKEEVTAKQVASRFQALAITANLRSIEGTTGVEYLVYSGPYASRADALGKLRMLHELQIDSFLITRGALADSISYGLFPKSSQADALKEELAELGYEVKVRENKRKEAQQWLVVPVIATEKAPPSLWQDLEFDFVGIDRQQKWCDAIASSGHID